jgi:glycosyltransferase involved in cell wall biosynthesis/SAM-dependent methyltransferase
MRIVVVSWRDLAHPQAGGCELLIDRLLTGLSQRDHDVALVAGRPIADRDYPVYASGGTYTQYLWAPLLCSTRLRNADLVIDVQNGLPFLSPLWRRRPSICLVLHNHGDQWSTRFPRPVAGVARAAEHHVIPAVYRHRPFVAISSSTADGLLQIGIDERRVQVIEPGVDPASGPLSPKSSTPLFVALTRLVPHKRVDLLLDAWRQVEPVTGGRFVVIGDGPELAALRHKAAKIPGAELLGWVDASEKEQWLGQAWFLVHGAHHEGWGLVILEAGSVGTPALVVDAPGVRDAVIDGKSGVVVNVPDPTRSSPLVKAWTDLARDPERRERLGVAALERASEYGWDRMVDLWEAAAKEVVAGSGDGNKPRKEHLRLRQPPAPVARRADSPPGPSGSGAVAHPVGLRRMAALIKGFRNQFDDPDDFYTFLADDTISLIERYQPVTGKTVVDVGGGSGYFAEAFRRAGATSAFVEPEWDEMTQVGRALGFGIVGDGCFLPLADGSFDVSFSSNVIEHVKNPWLFLDELVRVVRPGGLVFVAFTNWLSPFGGHETSPWHYAGGEWAARRYERQLGYPPKNRFGESLYKLSIGEVLRWARRNRGVQLVDTFPRYYPDWTKPLVHVPGIREVATWNLVVVLRRIGVDDQVQRSELAYRDL